VKISLKLHRYTKEKLHEVCPLLNGVMIYIECVTYWHLFTIERQIELWANNQGLNSFMIFLKKIYRP